MQCACAILPHTAYPALQYFATSSHKWYDFWKRDSEHKMFWFFLNPLPENISHSKNWARYDKKCTLVFMWSMHYSYQILMKLSIIITTIYKSTLLIDFWAKYSHNKIQEISIQWEQSCSMCVDGETWRSPTVTFHNFVNTPKKIPQSFTMA